MATILDGKKIANEIQDNIKIEIEKIISLGNRPPCLAAILLGDNLASTIYVNNKKKVCNEVGMEVKEFILPDTTSMTNLLQIIDELNKDTQIDGILVQLPLPNTMNANEIVEKISIDKDVDGFHPYNLGKMAQGKSHFKPCTAAAIALLLERTHINLEGLNATVIGTSNIVGKPAIIELLKSNVTVTCCHKYTKDLEYHIRKADIVVAAAGSPHLIPGSWLKKNSIVIDVGINRTSNGKLVGDVAINTAVDKISWYTPVPGGVGPITVAMLLQNTLQAYKLNT